MVVKYNLKDNYWLSNKYAQKEHWVPCYFKKHFFVGMSSTQRCEGMNSYFQDCFKGTMTSYKFVKQYEKAIARHREKGDEVELRTSTQLPQLSSQYPLKENVGEVYIRRMFDIFKKYLISSFNLSVKEESAEGLVRKFKVGPFKIPIEQRCMVIYDSSQEVQCECRFLEFMGILCKYALKEASSGLSSGIPVNSNDVITTRSLWRLRKVHLSMMSFTCSSPDGYVAAMRICQWFYDNFPTNLQNLTGGLYEDSTNLTQTTVEARLESHDRVKIP
ncbi:protein FAR1-RELATED SEQUENCE 1-like [Macadamia integrifolia]|uniref:protein FAR1-RELATED SEQUENCE 1-like n=1 Tax=Macadamia integrifolia TaxID=60698 RepID=UPI001C4E4E28|nr:protein FAR1-RELATED SEQUENCE 1-like [Macadamia integrifolia]